MRVAKLFGTRKFWYPEELIRCAISKVQQNRTPQGDLWSLRADSQVTQTVYRARLRTTQKKQRSNPNGSKFSAHGTSRGLIQIATTLDSAATEIRLCQPTAQPGRNNHREKAPAAIYRSAHGTVALAPVCIAERIKRSQPNPTQPICPVFEQEYQDGDSEDMPEDEALGILLPFPLPSPTTMTTMTMERPEVEEVRAVVSGGADRADGDAGANPIDGAVLVSGMGVLPTPSRSTAKKKKKKKRVDVNEGRSGEVEAVSSPGGNASSAQKKGKRGSTRRVEDTMGLVSG